MLKSPQIQSGDLQTTKVEKIQSAIFADHLVLHATAAELVGKEFEEIYAFQWFNERERESTVASWTVITFSKYRSHEIFRKVSLNYVVSRKNKFKSK